jgi:hypothetical protein
MDQGSVRALPVMSRLEPSCPAIGAAEGRRRAVGAESFFPRRPSAQISVPQEGGLVSSFAPETRLPAAFNGVEGSFVVVPIRGRLGRDEGTTTEHVRIGVSSILEDAPGLFRFLRAQDAALQGGADQALTRA